MKMVEQLRLLIRQLKWGRLETNLGIAGFLLISLGHWVLGSEKLAEHLPEGWNLVTPAWVVGGLLVLVSAAKLWRLTTRPVDIPTLEGPVVRGASAFTPEDGEIFKRLGRQEELRKLRDWILDDQVPLVVVKGPSGVGKTSLLRAGVQNLTEVDVAYWEAVASEPAERLRKAIRAQLDDPSRGVLLIDQGEQLGNDREVFEMLRTHLEADPPYHLTWILAIRNEYMSDWIDWSQTRLSKEVRQRIEILPILPLSRQQATEIFSILADEVGLVLREEVREEVIRSIADSDRVSPVDLAISLQVLTRNPRHAEDPRFLLSIGGHSAMLTSYLEGELEAYDEASRGELCRALLELIDLESDRRKAEGATITALTEVARPASSTVFTHALERLALPAIRVLELRDGERLRLVHERFIPSIRRLAGAVLSTAEQASRLLAQRCALWLREGEANQFLLTSRELGLIDRELPRLEWGKDRAAKERFLSQSMRRRRWHRIVITTGLVLGLVVSDWGYHSWKTQQLQGQISSLGLPADLERALPRLKSLDLSRPVRGLDWLDRASQLETMFLNARGLGSLRGIPQNISRLTLDLSNSKISTLADIPTGVSQLTLNLSNSKISTLADIPTGVSQLTLNLSESQVTTLADIPTGVSQLTLNLSESQVTALADIPSGVSQLILDLSRSQITTLAGIPSGVSSLTLNLSESQITSLAGIPSGVSSLTLDLSESQITTLADIPIGVSQLSLDLRKSRITTLGNIPAHLSRLAVTLGSQIVPLADIPRSVSQLTLDLTEKRSAFDSWRRMEAHGLNEIPPSVAQLNLHLQDSMAWSIGTIPPSVSELNLKVDFSETSSLESLPSSVSKLDITLQLMPGWDSTEFPPGVSELTLFVLPSSLSERSLPPIPPSVSQLSLLCLRSEIVDLFESFYTEPAPRSSLAFPEVPASVAQLTLYPCEGQALDLSRIPPSVSQLKLNLSDTQISSLRKIPASITELTLDLRDMQVLNLEGIPTSVSQLTVDLRGSQAASLAGLEVAAVLHLYL